MSGLGFSENVVEEAATLAWLESVRLAGQRSGAGHGTWTMPAAERADYGAVVLERLLSDALARLNPSLPSGGNR